MSTIDISDHISYNNSNEAHVTTLFHDLRLVFFRVTTLDRNLNALDV